MGVSCTCEVTGQWGDSRAIKAMSKILDNRVTWPITQSDSSVDKLCSERTQRPDNRC